MNRSSIYLSSLALSTALLAAASPVSAGPVVTVTGYGTGFVNAVPGLDYKGAYAGSYLVNAQNNGTVEAFNLTYGTDPAPGTSCSLTGSTSFSGKAATIAQNHATLGTPNADPKVEAAATQVAIWSVVSGFDPTLTAQSAISSRAQNILGSAQDSSWASLTDVSVKAKVVKVSRKKTTLKVALLSVDNTPVSTTGTVKVGKVTKNFTTSSSGTTYVKFDSKAKKRKGSVKATVYSTVPSALACADGSFLITTSGLTDKVSSTFKVRGY